MSELQTDLLFDLSVEVAAPLDLRRQPGPGRMIVPVTGGSFKGPRLSGTILPGGADWIVAHDGYARLDVRVVLKTDDGALIYLTYQGINTIGDSVRSRLAAGEDVPPSDYYFRTAVFFETGAAEYDWLNRTVAVGLGHRRPKTVDYRVLALA